ncbi:HpcH/HpaI aldolase family protein [Pontivivens ytuae]|uniref:HpcH/HpaI aldolase/citrate lyase domain-containing protein n=1 Tax=Pontivivens ytuae TaxID=2789856 RepID=A0A7S9LRH0_9RHOB|nr:aldolase/citrate lyase family protein [Pontivivens ytuae]QPH53635.1 hypothetical protein I0K15_17925 [Pontivivens ytuae]
MTRLGCWIDLPSPFVAEIVAQTGFDWALVDLEHGPIGVETMALSLMAIRGAGVRGYVRVPELSEAWIKRALDAGGDGVMIPNVQSVEQAEAAARWFHYAPSGARGEAQSVIRAAQWGRAAADYARNWPGDHQLILQIEGPEGLSRAADIAAVPGVGMLFLGPADYAAQAGLRKDAPEVGEAARQLAGIARDAGLACGSVEFPAGDVGTLAAMGFTDVSVASDVGALTTALDTALSRGREAADVQK